MSLVRTPEFESIEVILVGSFNPAIFHPQWFLRHGLIGEDEAASAKVKVVSAEVTEIAFARVKITCFHEQLVIAASNVAYAEKVHDLTNAILTLLPHTPIRAFGVNPRAEYRVETRAYWHKIGHTLAPKELVWDELYTEPGTHTLTIRANRADPLMGAINVTIQP